MVRRSSRRIAESRGREKLPRRVRDGPEEGAMGTPERTGVAAVSTGKESPR
jgi:hypothetical protein